MRVHVLPCVLLHVHARDADLARSHAALATRDSGVGEINLERAAEGERAVVLADLVALREIRVEVVLAGEDARLLHLAAEGERRGDGHAHGLRVEHGQRAREAEAHRARARVRRLAEARLARAERLRPREQLRVHLEADDDFPVAPCCGHRRAQCSRWSREMPGCVASPGSCRWFSVSREPSRPVNSIMSSLP